ncbi:glycosyltransferase family 2 protein [Cohnella massiliensis]|uniref:glycosyltransferase family 2 protein n=1 Tax=Cohnella massiliensis TaxID=1816691 RepID=UPI001BC8A72E|nr:glycosyltransferase family 2 protein [Cohnella massiliensis]
MINVVVPMAGQGSRFQAGGYSDPKPFIDVLGKTMIERVLENLAVDESRFILIVRNEHYIKYTEVFKRIENEYDVTIVFSEKLTEGACCSVLKAIDYINNQTPLLIANSDQIVETNLNLFLRDCFERNLDGSILTFYDNDPKWSYAALNNDSTIRIVREKEVISPHATVGIYFYSRGIDFVHDAVKMVANNDRVNNEFYVCPVYNYGIEGGRKFGIFEIAKESMHGLGIPGDLKTYITYLESR